MAEETEAQVQEIFRDLLKSQGWVLLSEAAKAQIESREKLILSPEHEKMEYNGKPVAEEFLKGEISGIRNFLKLPEILFEMANEVIKSQEKTNDSDNEET